MCGRREPRVSRRPAPSCRAATERGEGGRAGAQAVLASHGRDGPAALRRGRAGSVQPVGVFALGGYGRRELCLHSDIDLLVLFAGPIRPEDERFLHAFLNPLWDLGLTIGHHVREVRRGRAARRRQPGVPARADRRARGRRRRDAARSVHRRATDATRTRDADARRAEGADRRAPRALQRHALSARARREGSARRPARPVRRPDDCQADRPGAARPGRRRAAGARGRRGVPAARALDPAPRGQAPPQRPQPRAAGAGGRTPAAIRGDAAAAGRAPDGRLLPPRARHRSIAALGAARPRRRRSAPTWCASADGIRFVDVREAAERPETWLAAVPGGHRRGLRGVRRGARLRAAARRPLHGRGFLPDRRHTATRCCASSSRGPGCTRGCPRCTTPGCSGRCCPSSRRSPAAWCATSTTSTRSTSTRC